MLYFSKVKTMFILGALLIGFLFALPNGLSADTRSKLPEPFQRTINLGLDLQGGLQLLLEVDLNSVVQSELKNQRSNTIQILRGEKIRLETVRVAGDVVIGKFRNVEDVEAGMNILKKELVRPIDRANPTSPKTVELEQTGPRDFKITVTEENIEAIRDLTIEKSIEVLRNRIDPTGTTEMTLAKEGSDRILIQIPGAKNAEEIVEIINTTANLKFHMVSQISNSTQALVAAAQGGSIEPGTVYFPHQDTNQGGLIVEDFSNITGECLQKATPGMHPEGGYPIVNFDFNLKCAQRFGKLTSENIGNRFAVVLDDEIITAPRINSAITGGSGFIEGSFTMDSARQLSVLLNAGALPAKLKVQSQNVVDPTLGSDSINAGKIASIIGLVGVALFMWLSYGLRFGTIANMALALNIILIAGALSLLGATLTLPGIAGIILTIGMAVDANVLIFERIREEAHLGRPPVNAIDTGYKRSMAPILDANITTFIAAATLYIFGSGPIRGFAVTLGIGIIMSVFTAVIVARLFTATWLRRKRPKTLPI